LKKDRGRKHESTKLKVSQGFEKGGTKKGKTRPPKRNKQSCKLLRGWRRFIKVSRICNRWKRFETECKSLATVCNPLRHLLSFCRGMQKFAMVFSCLYRFAMHGFSSVAGTVYFLIVYHFSTGTSFTCVLPKVLKVERSTSLVSHLENFDPVKINKCTCLKFATQS
jgi:hypothetical protein